MRASSFHRLINECVTLLLYFSSTDLPYANVRRRRRRHFRLVTCSSYTRFSRAIYYNPHIDLYRHTCAPIFMWILYTIVRAICVNDPPREAKIAHAETGERPRNERAMGNGPRHSLRVKGGPDILCTVHYKLFKRSKYVIDFVAPATPPPGHDLCMVKKSKKKNHPYTKYNTLSAAIVCAAARCAHSLHYVYRIEIVSSRASRCPPVQSIAACLKKKHRKKRYRTFRCSVKLRPKQ